MSAAHTPSGTYDPQSWISGREARRIASVTPSRLWQLVAAGQVKTLSLPGVAVKFCRLDVERIAAEMDAVRQPA